MHFSAADLEELSARGISLEEAQRQLAVFARPPPPARLARPSTAGDGVLRLTPEEETRYERAGRLAAEAGRLIRFVPASGAATRMFQELQAALNAGSVRLEALRRKAPGAGVIRFLENLERFAFYPVLRRAVSRAGRDLDELRRAGDPAPVLEALLDPEGLGYAELPKALLAFHTYPEGARTCIEEHFVEAARTIRSAAGDCRLHFTISPSHRAALDSLLADTAGSWERRLSARLEVSFSHQRPSTDTLAAEADGSPFRDRRGRMVFRPGGHGALLDNLEGLGADLVLIKNIDNVAHERLAGETYRFKRILTGLLAELQAEVFDHLRRLDTLTARAFLEQRFFLRELPADREALRDLLARPVRVCGVVRNRGEPGGGPFWIRGDDAMVWPQIVESAQVDLGDPAQKAIFERATHFNPVDIVCGLRDHAGRPFDLRRFRDDSAVFVSTKSMDGRPLRALELPGLWNGGMARWLTLFVEVPIVTFNPVKSVLDLLRPAHQPE